MTLQVNHLQQSNGNKMTKTKARNVLYEGKAKIIYEGPEAGTLIQHFKDDVTAFNNKKKEIIPGKGIINNRISEYLMGHLNSHGIATHFIRSLNMREQLVKRVTIIPVEVVIRNVAAGSMVKNFGIEEGTVLPKPLIEFYLKNDKLGDPLITEEHIFMLNLVDPIELDEIKFTATRINDFLAGIFIAAGIRLVDFKLEFGRINDGDFDRIILADEISPDTCRLWDLKNNDKLDKDVFRLELGDLKQAYKEVATRFGLRVN